MCVSAEGGGRSGRVCQRKVEGEADVCVSGRWRAKRTCVSAEGGGRSGRVRGSGRGGQSGGIGLSGLGQRCGELIANCD